MKNIKHWWDALQYQCPKCQKYLAFYLVREGRKYYYSECKFCGFKRKSKILWGEYKHKNGKTYLRTDDWNDYREVYLDTGYKKGRKYLKVREVDLNNIKLL